MVFANTAREYYSIIIILCSNIYKNPRRRRLMVLPTKRCAHNIIIILSYYRHIYNTLRPGALRRYIVSHPAAITTVLLRRGRRLL